MALHLRNTRLNWSSTSVIVVCLLPLKFHIHMSMSLLTGFYVSTKRHSITLARVTIVGMQGEN